MEPEAIDFFGRMVEDKTDMQQQQGSASTMAMLSIAVSMKRIADTVAGGPDRQSLADAIQFAITEAIYNATRK